MTAPGSAVNSPGATFRSSFESAKNLSLLPSESVFSSNSVPASDLLKRILSKTTCQPLRSPLFRRSGINGSLKNFQDYLQFKFQRRICYSGIGTKDIVCDFTIYPKMNATYRLLLFSQINMSDQIPPSSQNGFPNSESREPIRLSEGIFPAPLNLPLYGMLMTRLTLD